MLADTTKSKKTQEEGDPGSSSVDTKASAGRNRLKNANSGSAAVTSMKYLFFLCFIATLRLREKHVRVVMLVEMLICYEGL